MTNLDYLKNDVDIVDLAIFSGDILPDMRLNHSREELMDLAYHMVNKEILFSGSIEEIAKRFLICFYVEEVDTDLYLNPFVGGDMAYERYYDGRFESPEAEILSHIIDFLNAEYDESTFLKY